MGRDRKGSDGSVRRPFAKRSLGQNFLTDVGVVRRIIAALDLDEGEPVLEIGPGRGALTNALLDAGANVTAVELDDFLAKELSSALGGSSSLEVIHGDFLEVDLPATIGRMTKGKPVKITANLPYYISTPILRKLFGHRESLSDVVVMLQKEVADRVTAPPGTSDRGYLTVLMERGFSCEKLFDVPPGCFRPVPKVMSSVVRLVPKPPSKESVSDDDFEKLVSAGFRQKRKTLKNNLSVSGSGIEKLIVFCGGIDEAIRRAGVPALARAESLASEEWESLARVIFSQAG